MARQITIDPPFHRRTREITIQLDDAAWSRGRHHITQFRGFEKLCEGRPFHEMPSLMARICGSAWPATWSPRPRPMTRSWRSRSRRRLPAQRHQPGAAHPVARAPRSSICRRRSAARHGRRPDRAGNIPG